MNSPSVRKINRRHAKRWAYSKTISLLDTVMGEGWPHFEGFLPETADKLEQALHEVRDSLAMKGLLVAIKAWNRRVLRKTTPKSRVKKVLPISSKK